MSVSRKVRQPRREAGRLIRACCALAVVAAAGCDLVSPATSADGRDDLQEARALWAAAGIRDYELTVERFCFCGLPGPVEVRVVDGTTVSVTRTENDTPVPVDEAYPDVEGLFAVVDDALARRAHRLQVTYHPTLGYPTHISIDYEEYVADEELAYEASLRVLRDEG
jgi:hypothetical protein